jgi:segregation and condensation protein B
MEEERLKAILESLMFAAGEPVSLARLAAVLDNVPRDAIKKALGEMVAGYGARGVVLEEVAGGYQLRTPKEHALYVRKLLAAKPPRLSRPLLETLAIVAYRQPVTRPEIEQLRGVDSGGVLDTLLERRLVRIAGRKEAPGRPIMYATSPEFLEVFGLRDLDGLPDLEEFKELEERAAQQAASEQEAPGPQQELAMAPSAEAASSVDAQGEASIKGSGEASTEASAETSAVATDDTLTDAPPDTPDNTTDRKREE